MIAKAGVVHLSPSTLCLIARVIVSVYEYLVCVMLLYVFIASYYGILHSSAHFNMWDFVGEKELKNIFSVSSVFAKPPICYKTLDRMLP